MSKTRSWKKLSAAILALLMTVAMMATGVGAVDGGWDNDSLNALPSWKDIIDEMLERADYVEGEVLVVYDNASGKAPAFLAGGSCEKLGSASYEAAAEVLGLNDKASDEAVSVQLVTNHKKTTRELLEQLAAYPQVLWAEPNYYFETVEPFAEAGKADTLPYLPSAQMEEGEEEISDGEEPGEDIFGRALLVGETKDLFEEQGYETFDDLSSLQWAYDTPPAQDLYSVAPPDWNTAGGANVSYLEEPVVAVIDSGIDYTHPDLAPVMVDMTKYNMSKGGRYGYNPSGEGAEDDPLDSLNGHGTHCAGIIASAWDGIGTSGVASGVKLCAVKASNASGMFYETNVIRAFLYLIEAVDHGMNLLSVNCSFGGDAAIDIETLMVCELGRRGVVTCYASGNSAYNNDTAPTTSGTMTGIPYSIKVNASTATYDITDYSNFGQTATNVFSPGDAILSPVCGAASSYIPSTDDNRAAYDTFDIAGDPSSGVKVYHLNTVDLKQGNWLVMSQEDLAEHIENEPEIGARVEESESFDGDGCSYKAEIPRLKRASERELLLVSVPVAEEAMDQISYIGIAVKSTLNKATVWALPVSFMQDEAGCRLLVDIPESGGNWQRPSQAWSNLTMETNDIRSEFYESTPYYDGRIFFVVSLQDPDGSFVESDLYIDCVGGGTDVVKYNFYQGTSMATPAVTGSVAVMYDKLAAEGSLDGLTPGEKAIAVANAVKASTEYDANYDGKCSSNGAFSFLVEEGDYTPVVNTVDVLQDGTVHIKGQYFGTEKGMIQIGMTMLDILSWTETEISASLVSGQFNGLFNMDVCAANGKKVSGKIVINGMNGRRLFDTRITLPEELANARFMSMTGLNGSLYVIPEIVSGDYDYPIAIDQLWFYDRDADTWTRCADIPLPDKAKLDKSQTTVMLIPYDEFVAVQVHYLDKEKDPVDFNTYDLFLEELFFYNPASDTWTKADFGGNILPMNGKYFSNDYGLFYVGGNSYVEEETEIDGEVYHSVYSVANSTIFRLEFEKDAIESGALEVSITGLSDAGEKQGANTFGVGSSYGNISAIISSYVEWMYWSPEEQRFTEGPVYKISPSIEVVGSPTGKDAYIPGFAGAVTPNGVIMAGIAGSERSGRGFDTFYVDEEGTITMFDKFAYFADLYNTHNSYTDGYLYVWGDTYFNSDTTSGYLTCTRLEETAEWADVESISLNAGDAEMPCMDFFGENYEQATLQLRSTIYPANVQIKGVKWSSSNPESVDVDKSGLVTVLKYNKEPVVITATSIADPSISASIKIQPRFFDATRDNVGSGVFKAVYALADDGIIQGYSGAAFQPENECTRAEFAVFLYRLSGKPAVSEEDMAILESFSDYEEISELSGGARKALAWACRENVISGYSDDGTLRPYDQITRAQIVVMLWRVSGRPEVSEEEMSALTAFTDYEELSDMGDGVMKCIAWGVSNGIVKGFGDGHFGPSELCKRSQIAIMLWRHYYK